VTDPVIRYGWRDSSVRGLAYRVARSMPVGVIPLRDRQDIAYYNMIVKLYEVHDDGAPEPTSTWLYNWGRQAVSAAVEKELREHGYSVKRGAPMRGYFTWWMGPARTSDELEDRVIEPIAVRQIVAALPCRDRQTLQAVADYGHITAAAEVMGWPRGTAYERLAGARLRAKRLWSYPDPPARQWANDPPYGAASVPIGEYLAGRRRRKRAT